MPDINFFLKLVSTSFCSNLTDIVFPTVFAQMLPTLFYRQEKDEAAAVAKNAYKQVPKMLTINRKIFVDKKLTASQNFTQKSFCW